MRKTTLTYLITSSIILLLTIIFKLINITNYTKGLANNLILFSLGLTIIITILALVLKNKINKKTYQSLDLLWFTLTIVSIVSFINLFLFSTVSVQQKSMLPTYNEGDLLLISKFNYKPEKGDVVIVNTKTNELYIKRVMALEGDLITFLEDEKGIFILVNNEVIKTPGESNEKYYISSANKEFLRLSLSSGIVPKNKYFVLGDNAAHSNDSRDESIGLIDLKDVLGRATRKIKGGK